MQNVVKQLLRIKPILTSLRSLVSFRDFFCSFLNFFLISFYISSLQEKKRYDANISLKCNSIQEENKHFTDTPILLLLP